MTADQTRTSTSEYNQGTDERVLDTQKSVVLSSKAQQATVERDLRNVSSVNRTSSEKANIAFEIAFTVPVLGRFPINSSCQ